MSKINGTKDVLRHKANDTDKSKVHDRSSTCFFGRRCDMISGVDPISTKTKDVKPTSQTRAAAPSPADTFTFFVKEKLDVVLRRDGGISSFDLQGELWLRILNRERNFVKVEIEKDGNPEIVFITHPNIKREMFTKENILELKRPDMSFPTGEGIAGEGCTLLKWSMQTADNSMVPLTIHCSPEVSRKETFVSIKYKASSMFDLKNVIISVPLPALSDAPSVEQCDGVWRYDSGDSVLEWSILRIDNSNRSGSMEFAVPPVDSSVFLPIYVQFAATNCKTYSGLRVTGITPLRGDGGPNPSFTQRTQLIAQSYRVTELLFF